MFLKILLGLVVLLIIVFMSYLVIDIFKHKEEYRKEKVNRPVLAVVTAIIYFFSTFGVSDFAIGSIIYPKLKWVKIKKLPGTINASSLIPTAVMALIYMSSVNVDIKTLTICIVAQVLGGYLGPEIVVKLDEELIKKLIGVGLIVVSFIILLGQVNIVPINGTATELTGVKLVIGAICLFIFGALNNIGIGSFSLTMVTMYLLGMNPIAAFPIMMGATTFSVGVGSMQFIRFNEYNRKITLYSSTFGIIGVVIAAYIVKSLDTYYIKWIVMFVLLVGAYTMLNKKEVRVN